MLRNLAWQLALKEVLALSTVFIYSTYTEAERGRKSRYLAPEARQ